jgi:hypothetical protein
MVVVVADRGMAAGGGPDQALPDTIQQAESTTALTPIRSIRRKCLDCSGGSYSEVRDCQIVDCELHPYRFGKRPPPGTAARTPVKAMRAYCLSCCRGQAKEVRLCPCDDCELHPYRFGKRAGTVSKDGGLRGGSADRSGQEVPEPLQLNLALETRS